MAKNQIVNVLGFVGYVVSVAVTELRHYGAKATPDRMLVKEYGSISIKLYLQSRFGLWEDIIAFINVTV